MENLGSDTCPIIFTRSRSPTRSILSRPRETKSARASSKFRLFSPDVIQVEWQPRPSFSARKQLAPRLSSLVRPKRESLVHLSIFNAQVDACQQRAVESAVTRLLVSIKALLEALTNWSLLKIDEIQVSDVYVRLGNDFNAAVAAFAAFNIDMT